MEEEEQEREEARASDIENREAAGDVGRAAEASDIDSSSDLASATRAGTTHIELRDQAVQTERVRWDQWDPANWLHILKDKECDKIAIDTFMLMAQLPHPEATYHSNQIMSYLLAQNVRKPSQLVHSWSIDARLQILKQLEWQLWIDPTKRQTNIAAQ